MNHVMFPVPESCLELLQISTRLREHRHVTHMDFRGELQRDGVEERRHGVPQVFRNTCGTTPVRSTLVQQALNIGQTTWMVCEGCIILGAHHI